MSQFKWDTFTNPPLMEYLLNTLTRFHRQTLFIFSPVWRHPYCFRKFFWKFLIKFSSISSRKLSKTLTFSFDFHIFRQKEKQNNNLQPSRDFLDNSPPWVTWVSQWASSLFDCNNNLTGLCCSSIMSLPRHFPH